MSDGNFNKQSIPFKDIETGVRYISSVVVEAAKNDLLQDAKIGPWIAEYGEPVIVISKAKFERWFGAIDANHEAKP